MPTSNESRFDSDARSLIETSVKHEDVSKFQQEIQSMSSKDRLEFYQALNRQAIDYSYESVIGQHKGMGGMEKPFVDVEAVKDKKTGELVDMDIIILDNAYPSSKSTKVAERLDVFDPKDGSGKEIDALQQGRRDAGAYKSMDYILRADKNASKGSNYYDQRPTTADKSPMSDAIYKRMSEEIKDPERRANAQTYFNNPGLAQEKYETQRSSFSAESDLQQLPQDFQDLLREPSKRLAERRHLDYNRYRGDLRTR